MTGRRRFVQLALAAPLAAFAQPDRKRKIGILVPTGPKGPSNMDVFFDGMRELGYVRDRNLLVEIRYGAGRDDQMPALAADLVKQGVEVIVAAGPPATHAAKLATSTVPIVMGTHDPVEQGLVASLAKPGGNLTGWCMQTSEGALKQLEILRQAMPRASRVGIVANPQVLQFLERSGEVARGARSLGMELAPVAFTGDESLEPTFATLRKERAEAFLVIPEPRIDRLRQRWAALAAQNRLPAVYSFRFYADAGGLISYGASLREMIALWPSYVDKILKGARPGDLPVQTPQKYELVLNQKAAKEIGFTFPNALVLAADHIIR